jgi:hypothetical protein
MAMPSIGKCCLAPLSEGTPKPIGIRLTDLQPGLCSSCLPRVTRLHKSHQLGFDYMALFFVHIFVSRKEVFMLTAST